MTFALFWKAYPRKVAKPQAKADFEAITNGGKLYFNRQTGQRYMLEATAEEIVEGAKRFAANPTWDEIQFCPHPSTWLNAGRWMDEYEEISERQPFVPNCRHCKKPMPGGNTEGMHPACYDEHTSNRLRVVK